MDLLRETMNIGNICREGVPENFALALQKVLENINDINTDAEQSRKLTLEFNFQPSKTREVGEVTMKVTTKLAGPKPVTGNFFLSTPATGGVRGYARDPKQDELFAQSARVSERPS
jgi:hypothetical protein